MVKIRLTRVGTHKKPFFRIVVMDAKAKANGAYIENLGYYDPVLGKVVLKKRSYFSTITKWCST